MTPRNDTGVAAGGASLLHRPGNQGICADCGVGMTPTGDLAEDTMVALWRASECPVRLRAALDEQRHLASEVPAPTVTTTLPTEEGLYLFAGVQDVTRLDVRDLGRIRPELVRIGRNGSGKLLYVGHDFFHTPRHVRGAWIDVKQGTQEVRDVARRLLVDELAHRRVHQVIGGESSWGCSRGYLVKQLAGTFSDAVPLAEEVVDRAIELGVLVPSVPNKDGYYVLRSRK